MKSSLSIAIVFAIIVTLTAGLFVEADRLPVHRHNAHGLSFYERSDKVSPPLRLTAVVVPGVVKGNETAHVFVRATNVGRESFYLTTNLDPFVGGRAVLRNFYITLDGACSPIPIERMFFDYSMTRLSEPQMLATHAIVLLKPGQTFSGWLPLNKWSELVSSPGACSIRVHYSGSVPDGSFSHPFLSDPAESFPADFQVAGN